MGLTHIKELGLRLFCEWNSVAFKEKILSELNQNIRRIKTALNQVDLVKIPCNNSLIRIIVE